MAKETQKISSDDTLIRFKDGTEVEVAPLLGEASLWSIEEAASSLFDAPADEDTSAEFRRCLKELGILQQQSLHLDLEGFSGQPGYGSMGHKQSIILRPAPSPIKSSIQVVLFQDESGGLSWHFPDGFFDASRQRDAGPSEFTIQIRALAAQEAIHKGTPFQAIPQGPITKQGRNVFKVMAIPEAEAGDIIARLEAERHNYSIRSISPEDYRRSEGKPFSAWQGLADKRSLLVIHDLFSSVSGMLSPLSAESVAVLCSSYENRVIGLDHPTVSQTPEQNARFLIEALNREVPEGTIELDVLAHGRGGIVARTLAELGEKLGGSRLRVHKIFMAGVPNMGTPLADPESLPDLLNVFMNLHAGSPDGPALYSLELLLTIVVQLARKPQSVLQGIAAMGMKGYVRQKLNRITPPEAVEYMGVAADFQPDPALDNAFFTSAFKGEMVERVFAVGNTRAKNDLLVPTESLVIANMPASMQKMLIFQPDDHVCHSGYFSQPRTFTLMKDYFELREPSYEMSEQAVGSESFLLNYFDNFSRMRGAVGRVEISESVGIEAAREEPTHVEGGHDIGAISWPKRAKEVDRDLQVESDDEGLLAGFSKGAKRSLSISRNVFDRVSSSREKSLVRGEIAALTNSAAVPEERAAWPGWDSPTETRGPNTSADTAASNEAAAVQRTPAIEMPRLVREGEIIDVKVSLRQWLSGVSVSDPLTINIPTARQEVSVVVLLKAEGFEVVDGVVSKEILVKRTQAGDEESATFKLKALSPGRGPVERYIRADFWQDNANIGWVSDEILVVPAETEVPAPAASSISFIKSDRRPCNLILVIDEVSCGGSKEFELYAQSNIEGQGNAYVFKKMGRLNINSEQLAGVLNTFIRPFFNTFDPNWSADEIKRWREDFLRVLETLGGELWGMLPEKFQTEYFRLYETGNLESIWVHSGEVVFPWELVRPSKEGEHRYTLGQSHVLGRWLPQLALQPSPQQMKVGKMVILSPVYTDKGKALAWAGDEAAALEKMFTPTAIIQKPVDLDTVEKTVLDSTDVQLLHFTGHGDIDDINANLNYLSLENKPLWAASFGHTKLGLQAHAFIVLNACSVGMTNLVAGQAGGFPAKCLRGGFSGVLAPFWPVLDQSAKEFSLSLYKLLKQNHSVGEALSELRRKNKTDPTFQAYTFFGDPWARLLFL